MKTYRIFLKKTDKGVIDDLEVIRDGFNFWAFLFHFFYLLYKKLWKQSIIIFIILLFLNFIQFKFLSWYIIFPIQVCLCIYIGFEYADWFAKKLIFSKYQFLGYSSGNNEREAKLKFLDSINENYTNNDDKLEQKIF